MKLDIKTIRTLKDQLSSLAMKPVDGMYSFPAQLPQLTVDGVVVMGCGWMHPESFRDTFGEDAYQELLKQPRIPSLYPDEDAK